MWDHWDEDETTLYVKRRKTVHYGSLEEKERERILSEKDKKGSDDNVEDSDAESPTDEYMVTEDEISTEKQQLLEEFERRKKARQINVSTDDGEVKADLRQLGEPICVFGEGPADRRQRLRHLLARLGEDGIKKKNEQEHQIEEKEKECKATWYHKGSEALKNARYWIADFSIARAKARLAKAREEAIPDSQKHAEKQGLYKRLRSMNISCSQIGDTRPISFCQFSPNSQLLATASWSGLCKLWSVPDCSHIRTLRGHDCSVGAIVFHPEATLSLPDSACCMASCATDGSVKLWDLVGEEPIAQLEGLAPHRVSRVAYHPSGRFLATCVFDNSWRLWDLEVQEEILHQEGHSRPVYDISFQCDGSVAATAGMDSFGRLWDLRTGRCVMFMEGHLKPILSVSFAPNGYQIATGSEDNTVKIWCLRQRRCEYTIAAHTNLISRAIFEKTSGAYLITSSYDNSLKVWSHPGWTPIQKLSGHDGKVMEADISPDGQFIATSSYDRTFKLWAAE